MQHLVCRCEALSHQRYNDFGELTVEWGLTINTTKTKYMSLGTDINHLEVDNGDFITGCTEFRHLGSIFTNDGRDTKNVRHRVAQARKIVGPLNGIWWSKHITKTDKR